MLKHQTEYRVIYGDTDNMGMVYNANYFRWFEIGRAEMFRHLGLPYREIEERGIYLPISETHCKYLRPARYDDLVVIETTLEPARRAAITINYTIYDETQTQVLAKGYTTHACVDRNGRVVRPPKFLVDLIAEADIDN